MANRARCEAWRYLMSVEDGACRSIHFYFPASRTARGTIAETSCRVILSMNRALETGDHVTMLS